MSLSLSLRKLKSELRDENRVRLGWVRLGWVGLREY